MSKKAEIEKTTWDILSEVIYPDLQTIKLPTGLVLAQDANVNADVILIKKPQEKIIAGNEICFSGEFESEKKKVTLIITEVKDALNGNLKVTLNETLEMQIQSMTLLQLNTVKVMHGTIAEGNKNLNKIKRSEDKYPLIFQHEITGEDYDYSTTSVIERTSTIDLFFLCNANFEKWEQEDHYNYAIKPMRKLCNEFIQSLKFSGICAPIKNFQIFDHVKFGVYATEVGHTEKIFIDNLSGVQLKINVDFLKGCCEKKKKKTVSLN